MTGFEPNSHRSTRRPGGRIATIATRYESVEERVHELFAIPATGLATTALGERWPRYHLLCAHNDGMMVLADPVACEGAAKRQPVMGGRDQLGIE